jgi:hypothetical protein
LRLLSSGFCVTMAGMNELVQVFVDYVQDILGITVKAEAWDGRRSLPVFMQSLYDYYTVRILGEQCLMLVSHAEDEATPAAIRKHHDIAARKWTGAVIIVKRAIRSNDRQRLINYRVPFAVPDNQLYVPDIGLDLREHFRKIRADRKLFSPSTQVLALRVLLTRSYGPLVSTQLVSMLPYTPMTIKRALDELVQARIAVVRMRGRERELRLEATGRDLWNAALPFLRSPVQRHATALFPPNTMSSVEAGLTALSRYSMISAPRTSILAVSSEAWKTARSNPYVHETDHEDENAHQLEIWRYDPALLSEGDTVDRLSLFLSLRDSNDERIEAALGEMMESVQW